MAVFDEPSFRRFLEWFASIDDELVKHQIRRWLPQLKDTPRGPPAEYIGDVTELTVPNQRLLLHVFRVTFGSVQITYGLNTRTRPHKVVFLWQGLVG